MVRSQAMLFIGTMTILLGAGHARICGTSADKELLQVQEGAGAPPSKTGWLGGWGRTKQQQDEAQALLDLDADKQDVKAHSNDFCNTASSSEEIDNAPFFGTEIDKEARPGSWDDIQSAFKLGSEKSKEFSIRTPLIRGFREDYYWDTTEWTDNTWPQKLKEAIDTWVQSTDWDEIYYRVDYYWDRSRLWVSDSHGETYNVAFAICDDQGLPGIIKGDREHNKPHPAAVCGSPDDIKGALKNMNNLRYRKTTGEGWDWASIASDDAGWETVKGTIPSWAKSEEGELIWYAIGENHEDVWVFDSDRVARLVIL